MHTCRINISNFFFLQLVVLQKLSPPLKALEDLPGVGVFELVAEGVASTLLLKVLSGLQKVRKHPHSVLQYGTGGLPSVPHPKVEFFVYFVDDPLEHLMIFHNFYQHWRRGFFDDGEYYPRGQLV